MNVFDCEKEALVIDAVRCRNWNDALRTHAAACPVCADAAVAAEFLRELSDLDDIQVTLANGGLIWWKAQLKAKRAAAERATRPIRIAERVFGGCATLSAIGLLIWQWGAISAWIPLPFNGLHVNSDGVREFLMGVWEKSSPMIILGASALLIFFSFVGYLVWTEE
jgi:hypothetical protein